MRPKYPLLSESTIKDVQAEVLRASTVHRDKSLLNPDMPDVEKLAALVEEVGEVGKALTYDQQRKDLPRELLQVAGLALAWVESIGAGNG